ncbi:LolA family protein [Dyella tabacisoli]|uniref:Outer membrane lipoprotein carrier protein LolA n=1 Tax=Dyella tabacisoli TaxID=2282381 RepID=A0A369ULS8_9GAMM|nr:outer membrane lipoprotein carrier protein LolA [Dyella tabacisoli]RDD81712.1 outer membrane lipoprotein carrier protein LolA [Dyella tabacisoli]
MRYLTRSCLAWVLCLIGLGVHAQGDDPALLKTILAQLSSHPTVRAEFSQSRENPALAQPQISRGQLLFVIGHGMLWQIREPYQESLALTGSRTARIDAQGQLQTVRGGERGVSQVSQMLQSMLAGKPDDALRQFDVQAQGTAAQWVLRFVPRQSRMARVLGGIELSGGSFLEGIRIDLQNGESTRIRFTDTRDAGPLSALETHALSMP